MPAFRKASSRSLLFSVSKLNVVTSKIVVSGLKWTFVPRRRVVPVCVSGAAGTPRE